MYSKHSSKDGSHMPAIITHYLFGEEMISRAPSGMGDSRDEVDAFLLGNQGPDIFFFSYMNPLLATAWGIGTKLHKTSPAKFIFSLLSAANRMDGEAAKIGSSYVAGMACHFILDSELHPFVYSQQYAICDAGIEGLDRSNGSEVHAEIEKELDMLTLSVLRNRTVSSVDPPFPMLPGNDHVLSVISRMYVQVLKELYGIDVPNNAFAESVRAYRLATHALYSPRGIKSKILGSIERLFRPYSMIESMSHDDELLENSDFDNREHLPWTDPFTGAIKDDSYWDLFDDSIDRATELLAVLPTCSQDELDLLIEDVDFDGRPLRPSIVSVSDPTSD